jgi:hypothetical protein
MFIAVIGKAMLQSSFNSSTTLVQNTREKKNDKKETIYMFDIMKSTSESQQNQSEPP